MQQQCSEWSDKVNIYAGHVGKQLEAGRPQTTNMARHQTHSEKFKMNRNGNSILSENICDLLLV